MSWRRQVLLLMAASVSLSTGSGAQRVRFGSQGGLTVARITELDPTRAFGGFPFSRTNRIGAQAGVFATVRVRDDWSLQPEVNYTQKGVRVETSFAPVDGGPATIDIAVDYIEIPLLLRLDAARNRPWHPFAVAGPQLGIRVRCQTDLATSGAIFSSRCAAPDGSSYTIDTPFTRTEVGGVAGLGVTGPLGRRRLVAQLRYARSLRTISHDAEAPLSPKHAGMAILFGLGF